VALSGIADKVSVYENFVRGRGRAEGGLAPTGPAPARPDDRLGPHCCVTYSVT